jgi:enterochelin esterase-like enzyme
MSTPMTLAELRARSPITRADVDAFIAANEFPLVDPRGVTFVYRGEARSVQLRNWVYGLPTAQPLERIEGTDLWSLRIELPPKSRLEYKFDVDSDQVKGWILDPLNPAAAVDPFGANSVCRGYGYERPVWTLPDATARAGALEELQLPSKAFGDMRPLRLYLPARFRRSRQYPLLIVHDGDDFLRFADLKVVLDNLIHRLEIAPLVVALTQSPDRLREYGADPRHATFITEELLPQLESRLPLVATPAGRALMGASFGGVASLYTAWRYQGVYGKLLLESGSFAFSDIGRHRRGPVFDPVAAFMNEFRKAPGLPAQQLFVSCGIYESLIYENRSLLAFLQDKRMQVRYHEVRDGHNWENWRDRLQDALSWLFPGPLWMVYE